MLGIFYSLVRNVLKTEVKPDIFKSSTEFEVSLVYTASSRPAKQGWKRISELGM